MTLTKRLLIVFVVLGELLILSGLMVCYAQWPNIFQGLYIGPVLVVIGLAVEILSFRKLQLRSRHQANS